MRDEIIDERATFLSYLFGIRAAAAVAACIGFGLFERSGGNPFLLIIPAAVFLAWRYGEIWVYDTFTYRQKMIDFKRQYLPMFVASFDELDFTVKARHKQQVKDLIEAENRHGVVVYRYVFGDPGIVRTLVGEDLRPLTTIEYRDAAETVGETYPAFLLFVDRHFTAALAEATKERRRDGADWFDENILKQI